MTQYICPNCGFIHIWKTKKNRSKRSCKKCGCKQVYLTKKVLESIMKKDILMFLKEI